MNQPFVYFLSLKANFRRAFYECADAFNLLWSIEYMHLCAVLRADSIVDGVRAGCFLEGMAVGVACKQWQRVYYFMSIVYWRTCNSNVCIVAFCKVLTQCCLALKAGRVSGCGYISNTAPMAIRVAGLWGAKVFPATRAVS